MSFEELNKILDGYDHRKFRELLKENKLLSVDNIIKYLVTLKINKNNFDKIFVLAQLIFGEIQGQYFGRNINFEITSDIKNFQIYMYSFCIFYAMDIDFEQWEDVASAGFLLLKKMVEKNDFNFKDDPDFQKIGARIDEIIVELRKDPDMDRKYFDYLNGAL